MTAWDPFKVTIDSALMGGLETPGLVMIERAGSPRKWDERNGYGWSGSFPVFVGLQLSQFDITFRMFNSKDWARYQALRPLLIRPPFGKRPKAIAIVHPILEDVEIRSIVITDTRQLTQPEPGVWEKTIECLTFRRPKLALAKPAESAAKPAPTDPYDQLIEKLSGENQALMNELGS